MGMNTMSFNCPYCGQSMSGEPTGPNFTVLGSVPSPTSGAVVMLSCINGKCQRALGPYVIPPTQ